MKKGRISQEEKDKINKAFNNGKTVEQIARSLKRSVGTVQKYLPIQNVLTAGDLIAHDSPGVSIMTQAASEAADRNRSQQQSRYFHNGCITTSKKPK